jgi:hypothetical protein
VAQVITDAEVARHEALVRAKAASLCRGDAGLFDDLCQEGRLAVFLRLPDHDPGRAGRETFLLHHVEGAMRHYLRDHSRLIRLPAWVQERGEFPEAPQSLDGLGETEAEAGDPEQWLVDRRQDTERAALARLEASRVLRRARLSPRQLAAIRQREFTTVPLSRGQSHCATVAARKLRRAALAQT